jgi:hypothetical protein
MARWQGTTTERGYGYAHQAERRRRLALYRPGDLCAHGGEPLNYPVSVAARYLHLPHTADRTGYLPGLSCARHNIADRNRRHNAAARRRRNYPTQAKPARIAAKPPLLRRQG